MRYLDLLNHYKSLVSEAPQDAAQPDITGGAAVQTPIAMPVPNAGQGGSAGNQEQTATVPPEGYVDLVRLLAKALVMNIPAGSIDDLWTMKVNKESAESVREAISNTIKENENYEDNPERLQNPHFKKFYDSINENNFTQKYKQILSIMKRFSKDPKLG